MAAWLRIQLPVVRCHQKSGSVTGCTAAISMVTKMAMAKKCGRSSQRTARLSQPSGPGSDDNGAAERARVANLQDEGNEPRRVPGVRLVGRISRAQHPLFEAGAEQLGANEDREDQE